MWFAVCFLLNILHESLSMSFFTNDNSDSSKLRRSLFVTVAVCALILGCAANPGKSGSKVVVQNVEVLNTTDNSESTSSAQLNKKCQDLEKRIADLSRRNQRVLQSNQATGYNGIREKILRQQFRRECDWQL